MARSLARETAMKLVYAQMMGGEYGEETIEGLIEFRPTKDDRQYLDETVSAVVSRRAALDAIIAKYLVKWTIDRLARVDLSILRLAVFELTCRKDIPAAVVINEAVELSHVYSTEDAGAFINGVLGYVNRAGETLE